MTETPSSDAGPFELPGLPATPSGPPRRLSAEAARFLVRTVGPELERRKELALARTVRAAVRDGATERLADLPERERRNLLEALERRLSSTRRAPDPRVVVELTAFLGGVSEPGVRLSRWRTAPAR